MELHHTAPTKKKGDTMVNAAPFTAMNKKSTHAVRKRKRTKKIIQQGTLDCCWCYGEECNLEGKKYCKVCQSAMVRECTSCHMPFNKEHFFLLDKKKCNKCVKMYLKQKKKRIERKWSKQKEIKKKNENKNVQWS